MPSNGKVFQYVYLTGFALITWILLFFYPFIHNGVNSYITIHDNLDSDFVYKALLTMTGQAFAIGEDAVIDNVMNGLPRVAYQSSINFNLLLYTLLEPYIAYITNYIIVHVVAFIGMFLLLKTHIIRHEKYRIYVFLLSLCFASIPFYSQHGLSVSGQPLLLYAFLNILTSKQGIIDYILIVLFPVYSSLVLVGPFILIILALILIIDFVKSRSLKRKYVFALLLLAGTYIIVEFQMINGLFIEKTFLSHRTVWDKYNNLYLAPMFYSTITLLQYTHYHTGRFSTILIAACAMLAAARMYSRKNVDYTFLFVAALILAIATFYGAYNWFNHIFEKLIPLLQYFNASRFYFLMPLLWILLFALTVRVFSTEKKYKHILYIVLIVQLCIILSDNKEFRNNWRIVAGGDIDEPTYTEFFSPQLFTDIHNHIGMPKESYRVVSLGIHPSIAQFNGFYTLDSYQNNYDLEYKNHFRRIIAPELKKDRVLEDYFDKWGSRCYLFSAELGKHYLYDKNTDTIVRDFSINTNALKELGGKYIFSSVIIENYQENDLAFERRFSDDNSAWVINLYRVM